MDPLPQVTPGEVSPFVTSAATVKTVLDAVRRGRVARDPSRPDDLHLWRPAVIVEVENDTGDDLPVHAILTPTGVSVDPDAAPIDARRRPVVTAAAPSSATDPVLVVLDGIADGTIGRAVVAGVTVAQVSVTSTAHRFAKPIAGTSTHLASAATGPVRLLVPPTTTGTQMAYVLLGGTGTSASGGGTDGNCFGDGWRIGLTPDDEWALRVLPDGEPVYIGDDATVEINGVEYTIDFNYLTPSLTLTSSLPSAAPIAGTLDCTACPCLKFAFPRSAFGLDATVPHNFCARVLYVTVCQYCPAGWYCAREAGTDGLFEPLELLEGEACSDVWDVRSGPYESEDAARSDCGSTPGCSPDPRGIVNVFTMDLRGLVTLVPGQCAPGAMCDQWNRVWELSQPFPGDCFWQNRPQFPLSDCSGTTGGNFFSRIHRGESPFFGLGNYNRLFINFGTATWTYYGSVAGWDGRAPYTFHLASGPGVGGAPALYCNMPSTITIYPV